MQANCISPEYKTEDRILEINFSEIPLEIDLTEHAIENEAIRDAAVNHLVEHFWSNVESKIDCSLLPADTLSRNATFTGRIVEVIDTNQICVITKIDFQNNKSITVMFANGNTKLFYTHELKETKNKLNDMNFKPHKYVAGESIERNRIYNIKTEKNRGLAIVNPTRSIATDRLRVSFLTNSSKKIVEFMDSVDIISSIITD
ncbi:hypothetical protein ACIQYL_20435 [Lysinibacillus xylanilyticus]|uniref:hypothetical protein n=1 Tax=Lysinibacillus xylanilyticus TaxID=582475 RepID=UPI003814DBF8